MEAQVGGDDGFSALASQRRVHKCAKAAYFCSCMSSTTITAELPLIGGYHWPCPGRLLHFR